MKLNRNINEETFFSLKSNEDRIRFLLQYSILAPSTHNSQPWLFKISESNNYCDIYFDYNKRLPYTDKSDRGLYISIGACIENLTIAAKYFNVYKKTILILKKNFVARTYFKFTGNKEINVNYETLTKAILLRSNRRGIFQSKLINNNLISKIKKIAKQYQVTELSVITNEKKKNIIAKLTMEGIKIASKEAKFRNEISSWIHSNLSNKEEGMAGYSFNLSLIPSLIFPIIFKNFNLGSASAELSKKNLLSAQIICVVSSLNTKKSWIQVGQVAERIMLEGQIENISCTINFGAIEIDNLYSEMMKLLKISKRPQFLFSMGYMKSNTKFTPRFSVEAKVIS